jgi:hypothetical protein
MFVCSFIGILKLTNCNYINFLISFIGISFALSKFLETFVLNKKRKGGQNTPEVFRRLPEKRTGKDRRRVFSLHRFFYNGPERRKALKDRRSQEERQDGWVTITLFV